MRVRTMCSRSSMAFRRALSTLLAISATVTQAKGLPEEITIPGERVFPESLTSTSDGTVIISGVGARTIFRAEPGSGRAKPWIQPETDGMQGVYGVFADNKFGKLYACSGSPIPVQPGAPKVTAT